MLVRSTRFQSHEHFALGTARANVAPSLECPYGTQDSGWAGNHSDQTVLQQHCTYFDPDSDGIVWPHNTYHAFRNLGFNLLVTLFSVFIIHFNFSYPTCPGYLPDPFFRIYLANIHKAKHGSDTGTYDNEGRFIPQKCVHVSSSGVFQETADHVSDSRTCSPSTLARRTA